MLGHARTGSGDCLAIFALQGYTSAKPPVTTAVSTGGIFLFSKYLYITLYKIFPRGKNLLDQVRLFLFKFPHFLPSWHASA